MYFIKIQFIQTGISFKLQFRSEWIDHSILDNSVINFILCTVGDKRIAIFIGSIANIRKE